MKLKKIASLMLAGVMAVSMLAGCSGKGETKPVEPATGVNATTVIAALSKDTTKKVTFTASATLQATADKAMSYVNDGVVDTFDINLLKRVDPKMPTDPQIVHVNKSANDDKKAQSATFIVNSSDLIGASAEATAKNLAGKIDTTAVESFTNNAMSKLSAESTEYTDVNTNETYKYTFAYTADVAVVSKANDQGQVTYYTVVTLTRTPTRVAVEA